MAVAAPAASARAGRFGHGEGQVFAIARKQPGAARGIVRKAAAGQHHAPRRAQHRAIRQHHALHPVLAQQGGDVGAGAQIHPEVERRTQQPARQRIAVAQVHAAPMQRQVARMAQHALRGMQEGAWRAGQRHEGAQIRARLDRHAEERRLAHRFAQQGQRRAEAARVIGRGDDGTAAGARTGYVAIGVGDREAAFELQGRVVFEEAHHRGRGVEKGVHPFGIEAVAEHAAKIAARLCRVFDDARALRHRVARRPDPAARPGGRAADHLGLFQHHHAQPVKGRRHRRGQTRRAGTDHDQIAGLFGHAPPPLAGENLIPG